MIPACQEVMHHPGSGGWAQRERWGHEDAEGADERSLAGGGLRTREVVPPGARCSARRLLPQRIKTSLESEAGDRSYLFAQDNCDTLE